MNTELFLFVAFAIVAFVYASVGFGGGSSYLALLALAAIPIPEIRITALICNIIVVLGNSVLFVHNKQLNWRKNAPLVMISVPMAFLGARAQINEKLYFQLLGASLVLAAILLWFQPEKREQQSDDGSDIHLVRDGAIGGVIGLLSGVVGIGGGIFLSPVLHFLRWDTSQKIAATASLFILVNSIAGVTGQLLSKSITLHWTTVGLLGLAVFMGGQLGLRYSLQRFTPQLIRQVTAGLVLFTGVEVLWKNAF